MKKWNVSRSRPRVRHALATVSLTNTSSGRRRVGQAAGAHHGTFEREGVVDGGEQRPGEGWVDALGDTTEAGVDLLAGDPVTASSDCSDSSSVPPWATAASGASAATRMRSYADAVLRAAARLARQTPNPRPRRSPAAARPRHRTVSRRRRDDRDGAHQPRLRP